MKTTELAKRIVRDVRAGVVEAEGQLEGGTKYAVKDNGGLAVVIVGGESYEVSGNKRLTIKAVTKPKAKKAAKPKAGPKPDYIETVCRECGTTFSLSKFNPYHDICPDCRKAAKNAKTPILGWKKVECTSCGKNFSVNAYDYNIKVCPTCMAAAKKAAKASKSA